ncbi:MAG: hypothetical protein JXA50_01670 [Deltaproteobacteria bacterium]|nr:hypothetical protein [Deltaproteobacteria bacterium]
MAEETGAFIGGSEGYKRADMATEEELSHARNSLRSRARKLLARARVLESYPRREDSEGGQQCSFWG